MSTSIKFKSLWCSFFQSQNSLLISKSAKHVDNYNNDGDDKIKTIKKSITNSFLSDQLSDYKKRRENNNLSVRKSRAKSRIKIQECANRVQELKDENLKLNVTLGNLQSELYTLKELFQHCFSFNLNNLAIKPSKIPTSTLHKVIMQNKTKFIQSNQSATTSSSSDTLPTTTSAAAAVLSQDKKLAIVNDSHHFTSKTQKKQNDDKKLTFNETDYYYINQIKNALNSLVRNEHEESSSSSVSTLSTITENDEDDENKVKNSNSSSVILDHDYTIKMC